jgi:glycosyltransferase involved in cell wall biosynthesis
MRIDYKFTNAVNGGFGQLGKGIQRELENAGHVITDKDPEVILRYGVPDILKEVEKHTKPLIFYTVWESSKYPPTWVKRIEDAKVDLVLTATSYTQRALQRAGIKAQVWHHAVDNRWKNKKRINDGKMTFIHWNAYEWRKGWDIVLRAFLDEFTDDENVELIMKARDRGDSVWVVPDNQPGLNVPKVTEVIGHLTDEELTELIYRADVGVFPVKGEGWFMPSFEFAASGGAVILPKQGGLVEQWIDGGYLELAIDGWMNTEPRYEGAMFLCSVEDLKKKMRYCYEHQEEITEMGQVAAKGVQEKFNWSKIIKDLENYINLVR